jgi:hypothetical protein
VKRKRKPKGQTTFGFARDSNPASPSPSPPAETARETQRPLENEAKGTKGEESTAERRRLLKLLQEELESALDLLERGNSGR